MVERMGVRGNKGWWGSGDERNVCGGNARLRGDGSGKENSRRRKRGATAAMEEGEIGNRGATVAVEEGLGESGE